MSCLSGAVTRVSDFSASIELVSACSMAVSMVESRVTATLSPEVSIDGIFVWVTDFAAVLEQVCAVNIALRYLEIDPEIIWFVDGWATNDVISNTTWNVE